MISMLSCMFYATPAPVPLAIDDVCRALVRTDSSFIVKLAKDDNGNVIERVHVHNWPSWLRVGRVTTLRHFFSFWYGRGKKV